MAYLTLNRVIRLFVVLISILCTVLFISYTFAYLYPLYSAILLSSLIHPIVTFMEEKLKLPRAFAAFFVLFMVFAIIIGSIILIITEFIQSTTELAENIPAYFQSLIAYGEKFIDTVLMPAYHHIAGYLNLLDPSKQDRIQAYLQHIMDNITTAGSRFLENLLWKVPIFLSLLPDSITVITFIILATFFITKDWFHLKQTFKTIVPAIANESAQNIWKHLKTALFGFLKVQFILIIITGITIFIGLVLLKVNHPFTIAALTAMVDVFPYIGTGIVFIPWIIYLFFSGNYSLTIGLSVLYMGIIVGRQFLEPKLLSATIGLNPLVVLIAVFIGLKIWGIAGLFLAPVALIVLKSFHQSGVFKQILNYIKG